LADGYWPLADVFPNKFVRVKKLPQPPLSDHLFVERKKGVPRAVCHPKKPFFLYSESTYLSKNLFTTSKRAFFLFLES